MAHYYLGKTAFARDDFDKAKQELQASLRSNPQNLDAKAELALVHLRMKDIAISENLLADVLRQDPEHYKANLHLLNLYQRTKDPRTEEQAMRFEGVKKKRLDREQSLMRRVEFERN